MATDFDPYHILGVDSSASADDIWDAYSRLIGEFGMGTSRRTEIEAAYAVIGRPEQRKEYDARLTQREAGGVPLPPPDVLADALTSETAGPPMGEAGVPWTLRDIAKALILPLLLIALNVGGGMTQDLDTDDFTESDYVISYAFTLVLEVALLLLVFHFAVRKHRGTFRSLGFVWPESLRWWFPLAVLGAALVTIMLYNGALTLAGVEVEGNVADKAFDYASSAILLTIVSVAAAPLAEEVFFRAFLYQGLARVWGVWPGILASAGMFGLLHASTPESLLIIPPITAIGVIFAWAYSRTGSILPSLIAHVIFNLIAVVVGFAQ